MCVIGATPRLDVRIRGGEDVSDLASSSDQGNAVLTNEHGEKR